MSAFQQFFPVGSELMALPNWQSPRLFVQQAGARRRWRSSGLYPAFRKTAKLYRLGLRTQTALGLKASRQTAHDTWALANFVEGALPTPSQVALLVGTPGPAQKITAQLWVDGEVIAYLKYAEKAGARRRLAQEYAVLTKLPPGYGPTVLKYGAFLAGEALLTRAATGRQLPVAPAPDAVTRELLARLHLAEKRGVAVHPWCKRMRERHGELVERWLEPLSDEGWPVVAHHGDFAPWNILHLDAGGYCLIDWEYGDVRGFPHLDHAYYVLQVAALMSRSSPEQARALAVAALELPEPQARAIVSLSAYHAYQQACEDGHPADAPLMRWRRAVWEDI